MESVKPLLSKHDMYLNISDDIVYLGDRYYVKATASVIGEKGTVTASGYAREPLEQKGMNAAQITGSASSYARKYALNGLFAIDDTKDADSQDNREQMSPEPIDMKKVEGATAAFKELIDADDFELGHQRAKDARERLTNDEWIAVTSNLNETAPGGRKKYKSLASDYINYVPEEGIQK